MLSEINFVIFNRLGYDIAEGDLKTDEKLRDHLPINYVYNHEYKSILGMVSSTEVRSRIRSAKQTQDDESNISTNKYLNVAGLITKDTLNYIKENNLYWF